MSDSDEQRAYEEMMGFQRMEESLTKRCPARMMALLKALSECKRAGFHRCDQRYEDEVARLNNALADGTWR